MTALDAVLDVLRCPLCSGPLERDAGRLVCGDGHSFDVARQGYVNLAVQAAGARRVSGTADTAAMVAARDDFLGRGGLAEVTQAAVAAAAPRLGPDGVVLDLAGGTGHHLAAVLDAAPGARGICLDLSSAALRRAARSHARAAAVGADAWQRLPLAAGSADVVLSVFGPRDVDELARVLRPGGVLVVVSPAPEHFGELVTPMGMVAVDPRKAERQAERFAAFPLQHRERVTARRAFTRADVIAAVAMGPTAAHADSATIAARAALLPDPVAVTIAVDVAVHVRP